MKQTLNRVSGILLLAAVLCVSVWEASRILRYGLVLKIDAVRIGFLFLFVVTLLLALASLLRPASLRVLNLNLAFWSLFLLGPMAAEAVIRTGIALEIPALRNPELYARPGGDDAYWAMRYAWFKGLKRENLFMYHPLLGWSQTAESDENPLGLRSETRRRLKKSAAKIFFYGDSFVRGRGGGKYQLPEYMHVRIPETAVLDFSKGGYGIDQIYLMMRETVDLDEKPVILTGVLLDDLDRALLKMRDAPKPYFELDSEGRLVLQKVPELKDEARFVNGLLPKFYFLNMLRLRFLPPTPMSAGQLRLIERILEETQALCRESALSCYFVLFYGRYDLDGSNWREFYVKKLLNKLQQPYIDTRDILYSRAENEGRALDDFYLKGDGHHNNLGNETIAEGIMQYLNDAGVLEKSAAPDGAAL